MYQTDKLDRNFLITLYKLRCLTLKQAYVFFYKKRYSDTGEFYKERIKPLAEEEFCQLTKVNGEFIFKITQKTIDYVKEELALPSETYDISNNKLVRNNLILKDLRIDDKQVRHQLALNQFVLEFQEKIRTTFGSATPVKYYDEKYLSNMNNIRPDGLYRIGNIDLFLEQDMGTETSKQLQDKWSKYRRFLNYEFDGKRRIIVLFIVECNSPVLRRALVQKTIINSFDTLLNNMFDIYIGTKDEIMNACFNAIFSGQKKITTEFKNILRNKSYIVDDGSKLKVKLGGSVYRYYMCTYTKDKRIVYYRPNKNRIGRFQEFLGDNYAGAPMSVLSKIAFHDKNSHNFDIAYSPRANYRLIGYIILLDNVYTMYNDLRVTGLIGTKNVYFTTKERLTAYQLPKALFTFNEGGDIITCNNNYFEPEVVEGNIRDYEINGIKK